MSSPVFVNSNSTADAFNTTLTIPLPVTRTNGNLLIAAIVATVNGGVSFVWPAGWTSIDSRNAQNISVAYAYCYVTGAEAAPVVTWSGGTSTSGVVAQYSGTSAASPIGNKNQNSSSTSPMTTVSSKCVSPWRMSASRRSNFAFPITHVTLLCRAGVHWPVFLTVDITTRCRFSAGSGRPPGARA